MNVLWEIVVRFHIFLFGATSFRIIKNQYDFHCDLERKGHNLKSHKSVTHKKDETDASFPTESHWLDFLAL